MIVFALLACVDPPDREGIAIGNPPNLAARLAPPSGASVESAEMHIGEITSGCGTEFASVQDIGAVDLLGPNTLPLPSNSLCVLSVGASAPLELTLRTASGEAVTGRLEIGTLSLMSDSSFQAEGALVLELGSPGWLDPSVLAGTTDIESGSPAHAAMVAALRSGTSLFVDSNADGVLDAAERSTGALLRTSAAETAADTDSGCDGDGCDDQGQSQDQGNGSSGGSSGGSGTSGGSSDTGSTDTGNTDSGSADTGSTDTGSTDTRSTDTGSTDDTASDDTGE